MSIINFQDLFVWQKAHKLTLNIYKLTKKFPKDELFGLISQIRRSSVSICANIAEGHRKQTKEFSRFLMIAQGSLQETKYHLILSCDLEYCTKQEFEKLIQDAEEVGKMINGLRMKLK
ncbi:MAG: four helix bundle protein [Candidatus Omnitrophota bacterium]